MDLRTILAEAGKRTCTQAQFPWRLIFAGMANELRQRQGQQYVVRHSKLGKVTVRDGWQFDAIAHRLRPVCFQTGSCGFMAAFDRSCKIRERVDAFAARGIPPNKWGTSSISIETPMEDPKVLGPIHDYEWAADPSAARS
jgi:hypothetical protein